MKASGAGHEILVCGAGAAGCAAALAAARSGARVYLVEPRARPGGTVADSLIHTIGGLHDSAGNLLNDGLPSELAQTLARVDASVQPRRLGRTWVLNVCPDLYRSVLERWLSQESQLKLLCRAHVDRLETCGNRVTAARITMLAGHCDISVKASAVIDATGSADIVRLLDSNLVEDSDPPAAAGGLILRLRGVVPDALAFPRGAAIVRALRGAAQQGELPPDCARAWLDRGVRDDEAYLKLFVPLPGNWRQRQEQVTQAALQSGEAALSFLRRRTEFADASIERVGLLGIRDGGRIVGEYRLTGQDVRSGQKFGDAACRCAWPIEFWDRQNGVTLEYLPDGASYDIPLRALKVRGIENLWAVGKCLSADVYAQASARIAGCCWGMGEAVGMAVAEGAFSCN